MYVKKEKVKLLSCIRPFVTPWTIAYQAPLSMGFSWQEYWSGFPCPPPGDLPDPGIEPESLTSLALAGGFFNTNATWEALLISLEQKGKKKKSSLKLAPVFLTFKRALIIKLLHQLLLPPQHVVLVYQSFQNKISQTGWF